MPEIVLVRHGETAWTISRQHTGKTDLPLTEPGRRDAELVGRALAGRQFGLVLTSPLRRAHETCELAGFGDLAQPRPDLAEWDYGEYEGLRTKEILAKQPGWQLFRDGCPGGESPAQIGARADRVIARIRAAAGDVLVFSSAHVLRVLAARWLGLPPSGGQYFVLGTASLSTLGWEHDLSEPVIRGWNDTRHVGI